jgi:uncharacterized membrane protein YhhN
VIAATLVCACACVVLVAAEAALLRETTRSGRAWAAPRSAPWIIRLGAAWSWSSTRRTVAKLVASAAFCVVGVLAMDSSVYARWIVAGLVLGAIGDGCLLRDGGWFLAGLVVFLLGHLAYVAGIATVAPPPSRWLDSIAPFVPVGIGALTLVRLWPRLGGLRVPVAAYVAVIVAMVVGALATGRPVLIAGALLFFASDLSVAQDRFVHRALVNKLWGLPAYYAGQLLIAWSISR